VVLVAESEGRQIRLPNVSNLPPRTQLALLARVLCREGYDDHVAGHITHRQFDGTILTTPARMTWDEICAGDILTIDSTGKLLEGSGVVSSAISLHVELHRRHPDLLVAVHNHPLFGTIWSNLHRQPPIYDQSSSHSLGTVVFTEYGGTFTDEENSRMVAEGIGSATSVLLANHGVLLLAPSIELAYLKASYLELCCKHAWMVEAVGNGHAIPDSVAVAIGSRFKTTPMNGLWEAMARRELRRDLSVISNTPSLI
jgi:ribulose-5-phosphate 4-epimerase/fuculose-1-phosphate aldolase